MSTATFIDLAKTPAPETPTREVFEEGQDAKSSRSSLRASRSYHCSGLQPSQPNVIDIEEESGITVDDEGPAYPVSRPNTTHHIDQLQLMGKATAKSRGQSTFNSTPSSCSVEVGVPVGLPLRRLNQNTNSPSPKRRCRGLNRSSIPAPRMRDTFQLQHEEDTIVDLTINDNFPVLKQSKSSSKRGIPDILDISDGDEQTSVAQKGTPHLSKATEVPLSLLREARAGRRLVASGISSGPAAFGKNVKGSFESVVDLSLDSDSDEQESEVAPEALRRPKLSNLGFTQGPSRRSSVIGPEDYLSEDETNKRLAYLNIGPDRRAATPQRQLPMRIEIGEAIQDNSRYKAGKSAELKDGNFLRIISVFADGKGDIILSGHLLTRQNLCGPLMPKRRNELVWIVEMSSDDFEAGCGPLQTEVPLAEAVRFRNVTFTNQQYPEMSLKRCKNGVFKNVRDEVMNGPLFCRWKSIKVRGDRKERHEDCLVHITQAEADSKPGARIQPSAARAGWRGFETILGGSHFAKRKPSVNLASQHSDSTSEDIQQYTFGDAFCGAGGCSVGASQAGLRVCWGLDNDKDSIGVYAANLGRREGAECLLESVFEFCGRSDIYRFVVDILHMSPPCKPFSPAHTIPSETQDEINQAALLSVWRLLEKLKPRIATIEETEGLLNRHVDWFHALINTFICHGYSVRWKVVRFSDYGVAQERKRLCLIAAGPGETLPPFPKPTHGESGSGLPAFKKIRHYIRDIPRGATQHDTQDRFPRGPRMPFSDDQFAKTLTCSGGAANYHPSGLRLYTVRESASLQTFPISHDFATVSKTKARRQIGNAVPPLFARSMYREINKCLKEADRLEGLTGGAYI